MRHNQSSGRHFLFCRLDSPENSVFPFFGFVAGLLHFASANPLLLSERDRICRRIIDSFTPQLAYFLRFWCIANKKTTSKWCAHALWKLLFCLMTQIKPKTNRTIVATRCFCCCSLSLQQYRHAHSATPSRFTLLLKQLADTLASSARLDRIFAMSNGVFHVKHRFFYCFSIEILPVFYCAFCLFFFASFCFIGLSGVFGQALCLFLLFLRLCWNVASSFVGRQSSFFAGSAVWCGWGYQFCFAAAINLWAFAVLFCSRCWNLFYTARQPCAPSSFLSYMFGYDISICICVVSPCVPERRVCKTARI